MLGRNFAEHCFVLLRQNRARGNPHRSPVTMVILCDFDDTAAEQNIATLLLDRYQAQAASAEALDWRELRRRFLRHEISLAEYQEMSFRYLPVSHTQQAAYVQRNANLRPGFLELAAYCRAEGIELAIVSHGLDYYIEALLEAAGLDYVQYFAVRTARHNGSTTFEYTFGNEECDWWPGNCKCSIVEGFRKAGHYVVYAGDGASDKCPAQRADYVFARDSLLRFCRSEAIAHEELTDFHIVLDYVKSRAATDEAVPGKRGIALRLSPADSPDHTSGD